MPLTPFQRRVARLLAENRSEDSHLAGGVLPRLYTGDALADQMSA